MLAGQSKRNSASIQPAISHYSGLIQFLLAFLFRRRRVGPDPIVVFGRHDDRLAVRRDFDRAIRLDHFSHGEHPRIGRADIHRRRADRALVRTQVRTARFGDHRVGVNALADEFEGLARRALLDLDDVEMLVRAVEFAGRAPALHAE